MSPDNNCLVNQYDQLDMLPTYLIYHFFLILRQSGLYTCKQTTLYETPSININEKWSHSKWIL